MGISLGLGSFEHTLQMTEAGRILDQVHVTSSCKNGKHALKSFSHIIKALGCRTALLSCQQQALSLTVFVTTSASNAQQNLANMAGHCLPYIRRHSCLLSRSKVSDEKSPPGRWPHSEALRLDYTGETRLRNVVFCRTGTLNSAKIG